MSKKGLPMGVQMRHDSHYVEILSTSNRTIGRNISIDLIEPNPEQPRSEIGDLTELAASIKEKGVLEPLLVKPNGIGGKYMIIAGERRWRASMLAGLAEVPCIEMDLDKNEIAEIALIENLQRKDLNVWEEADGLAALAERFGYTQEQIAKKISKSRTTVTELMTVAGLPNNVRERCRNLGLNTKAALLEVARQFDEAAMDEYLTGLEAGKKPQKKNKSVQPSTGKAGLDNEAHKQTTAFSWSPSDRAFELKINFKQEAALNRKSVLQALKMAFDDVKAGKTDI